MVCRNLSFAAAFGVNPEPKILLVHGNGSIPRALTRRLHDGEGEASFQTEAPKYSLTGVGGCRDFFGHGGRRIRNPAGSECTVRRYRAADYSWLGGNCGRQLGDVLCLRQGERKRI